jgi:hypothetical protein
MSNDVTHEQDDLGLGIPANEVSMDDADGIASGDDQSANLAGASKDEAREEIKRASIKSWGVKILSGEKSIDDIPADKKWMVAGVVDFVESMRGSQKPATKNTSAPDAVRLVRFELLKEKVQEADLSVEDRKRLNSKYEQYKEKGFDNADALNEALDFTGLRGVIDGKQVDFPQIKTGGSAPVKQEEKQDFSSSEINTMSRAELRKLL